VTEPPAGNPARRRHELRTTEEGIPVKSTFFWIVWGIDALICAIVFVFFLIGLVDGSVSADNMELWVGIFAALTVITGGSLWLKSAGHPVLGSVLGMVLALPGLLYGLVLLGFVVTGTKWN